MKDLNTILIELNEAFENAPFNIQISENQFPAFVTLEAEPVTSNEFALMTISHFTDKYYATINRIVKGASFNNTGRVFWFKLDEQ